MPTERFYRLPESKKQMIREAALKEFARVPFDKASINQIIRNADISRGSFYTYFVDKQDVVEFLLKDKYEEMQRLCIKELDTSGGDYFAMVELMFEYFVRELQTTKDMIEIAKNIFSNQENARVLGMKGWPEPNCMEKEDSPIRWTYENVDKSRFRFETLEDFSATATLAMSSLAFSLKQYYEYPDQLDAIRRRFSRSLEILKYGSYRNND